MMNELNPYDFDRSLQVQSKTETISGDVTESWSNTETDVRAKLIFAGASEQSEGGQPLNIERRRYVVMESGRTFNPDTVRLRETDTTNWYYVTRVTPWKGSKWADVIECEYRSDS